MSFESEIYTVMTSDTSLNDYADGGIHYTNLKDNWLGGDTEDHWIVYDVRRQNQSDCINSKNVFMTYTLTAVVIQRETNTDVDLMTNRMINYLNNHESGNIMDIKFSNDQPGFNQQQGVYTNQLEFECTYIEN